MVFIGKIDNIPFNIKSAGTISSCEWYCKDTDNVSLNAELNCPVCNKKIKPLRSKKTESKGTSYPWVGCDYQDVCDHYISVCSHCSVQYKFKILYEQ